MTDESQDNLIDVLAEDFVARYRLGERPGLTEYIRGQPQLEEEIRALFPTLVLMEQARSMDPEADGTKLLSPTAQIPERLGEYRILREVGRGGMGIVYEAVQESLGRHVALKILPSQTLQTPKYAQRFQREARSAARLHHPNIVPVFGVGELNGVHYYAMQFIQGLALDRVAAEVRRLRSEKSIPAGMTGPEYPPGAETFKLRASQADSDVGPSSRRTGTMEDSAKDIAASLLSGIFAAGSQVHPVPDRISEASSLNRSIDSTPDKFGSSDQLSTTINGIGKPYWNSVARIGVQVAEALQYAADKGVLHRDIKPANLLLDLQGNVWVTDFGLAKTDDSDELTNPGDIIGTLRYLPPERLRGECDLQSDIYSLGVTLYELLVLKPLFEGVRREQMMSLIADVDPVRPRRIDPAIPGDLETVVLKAMAKDRPDRYATASDLANDLRRFMEDRPVLARRTTIPERFARWCRRNQSMALMMGTLAILATLLLLGGMLTNTIRNERNEAVDQRQLAHRAWQENEHLLKRAHAAEQETRVREHLAQAVAWQRSGKEGQRFLSLEEIAKAAVLGPPQRLRDELRDTAIAAMGLTDLRQVMEFPVDLDGPVCFDHRGDQIAQIRTLQRPARVAKGDGRHPQRGAGDFSLHIRHSNDLQQVRHLPGPDFACWYALPEYSPSDHFLAVIYLRDDGLRTLVCRDAETDKVVLSVEVVSMNFDPTPCFHPHMDILVYQEPGLDLVVYDLKTGFELNRFPSKSEFNGLCIDPDSGHLAVVSDVNSDIIIMDLESGKEVEALSSSSTGAPVKNGLAWSSDGQLLAACRADAVIEVWNIPEKKLVSIMQGHSSLITDITFSPGSHLLRTTSWDGSSRLWDAGKGQELLTTNRRLQNFVSVDRIAYTTDVNRKAGICEITYEDKIQRLHDPGIGNLKINTTPVGLIWATFSPDERLLVAHGDSFLDFWDVEARRKIKRLEIGRITRAIFHPDSSCMITVMGSDLQRWPLTSTESGNGTQIHFGPPENIPLGLSETAAFTNICWIPGHQSIATFDATSRQAILVNIETHGLDAGKVQKLPAKYSRASNLSVSPDGQWLAASGHHEPAIQIWNLATLEPAEIAPVPDLSAPVFTVNFSPDGKWLVAAIAEENTFAGHLILEVGTWRRHRFDRTMISPGVPVFFQSASLLASISQANEVQISDIAVGRNLCRIRLPEARFNSPIAAIRNDAVLAMITGPDGGDVVLWDLASIGRSLTEMDLGWDLGIDSETRQAPDNKQIVLTVDDGGLIQKHQLRRASALAGTNRFDEAVSLFESMDNGSGQGHLVLNELAWKLVVPSDCLSHHAALAVDLGQRITAEEPRNSAYWNTLGVAYYRHAQFREAVEALEKSESLQPGTYFIDNAIFLAMCYWHLWDSDSACRWYGEAVKELGARQPEGEQAGFLKEARQLLNVQ